jgi:hypothetical protein
LNLKPDLRILRHVMLARALPAAVVLALGVPVPTDAQQASATGPSQGAVAHDPGPAREAEAGGTTRRTASLAGRIIQPDGTPAEQARVAVYARDPARPGALVGSTTSAFDGRYEVVGLPAGAFIVGATPARTGSSTPVETFFPGVAEPARSEPISLFDGVPTEGIDIWLTPAAQRFVVAGRVFGPDGRQLRDIAIEYGGPTTARPSVWTVTDPGGVFTLEGVPPGTLFLLARAQSDAGPLVGLVSTEVSVGSVEDIRIVLRPPGIVDGRIVFESQAPPPGPLRVSPVQTWLDLSPLYPEEQAIVDPDGRFQLRDVVGENELDVRGLPPGWRVLRLLRGGRPAGGNRIIVMPGERVDGVEIVVGRQD